MEFDSKYINRYYWKNTVIRLPAAKQYQYSQNVLLDASVFFLALSLFS